MADVSKIKLPSGTTYNIKDKNALPLTGGSVTGPVSFGDSVNMDEATVGDLVVNGSASFTNNLQANTINGVTVGSNPKFTDTTYESKPAALGGTDVSLVTTNEKYQWNVGKWNGVTLNKTAETGTSDLYLPCMGSTSSTEAKLIPVYGSAEIGGSIPRRTTEGYLRAKTPSVDDNSTKVATTAYVNSVIDALPEPMVFKGSVGTGGTITSLPTAAASNEGHTYKVITALSSPAAKVGDTVISNGSSWVVIPSGDEPSGTVTSVGVSNGGGLSVSGSPITSSGTITISHADTSSQASSSNSGRTYIQSITLDTYGHVTGISTATESVTNTDTKLQVAAVTSGTQYYPIVGTGTSAATRQYDTTGFKYKGTNGTTSAVGSAILELGNSTASGTANNKQAQLIMYGSNAKKATITLAAPSADVALALPTSGGTLALTSQIPTYSTMSASELSTGTATTARTMSAANTKVGLLDLFYPVGSYYETSDTNFNPNTKWGGTWVLEEAGRVHVSAGTGYTIGSKGGEATHTLTVNEMPSHAHIPNPWVVVTNANYASAGDKIPSAASGSFSAKVNASANSDNYMSSYVGGGQAHNNMQPYIVVNRWHRTA